MSNDDSRFDSEKDYWRHYRYSADPFTHTQHTSLFLSPMWDEYLDLLSQFLRYCNSLILMTGESGVGKTALVKEFIKQNQDDAKIMFVTAADMDKVEKLLRVLHEECSAPYDPSSTLGLTDQIEKQIDFLKQNNAPRMLIIDDAERLPLDMRQACLQIAQQQSQLETCLPILLVGDTALPEQYHALLTPKTAEKCLYTMRVEPFDRHMTQEYLAFACRQVSQNAGNLPFSEEDTDTVYSSSRGIVRMINQEARDLLIDKLEEEKMSFGGIRKKLIWWGLTVLVIILVLCLFKYLTRPHDPSTTFASPLTARQAQTATDTGPTTQVANVVIQPETSSAPALQKNVSAEPESMVRSTQTPTTASDAVSVVSHTAAVLPSVAHSSTIESASSIKETGGNQRNAVISHSHKTLESRPKPYHSMDKALQKHDLFNEVMHEKLALQRKRILAIHAGDYTLQLLASNNLHTLQKFIALHQLQSTAMIVKTEREGKAWYTMIYGVFKSRLEAEAALKKESLALQQLKPWVRSYASIHTLMQADEKHVPHKK